MDALGPNSFDWPFQNNWIVVFQDHAFQNRLKNFICVTQHLIHLLQSEFEKHSNKYGATSQHYTIM